MWCFSSFTMSFSLTKHFKQYRFDLLIAPLCWRMRHWLTDTIPLCYSLCTCKPDSPRLHTCLLVDRTAWCQFYTIRYKMLCECLLCINIYDVVLQVGPRLGDEMLQRKKTMSRDGKRKNGKDDGGSALSKNSRLRSWWYQVVPVKACRLLPACQIHFTKVKHCSRFVSTCCGTAFQTSERIFMLENRNTVLDSGCLTPNNVPFTHPLAYIAVCSLSNVIVYTPFAMVHHLETLILNSIVDQR